MYAGTVEAVPETVIVDTGTVMTDAGTVVV